MDPISLTKSLHVVVVSPCSPFLTNQQHDQRYESLYERYEHVPSCLFPQDARHPRIAEALRSLHRSLLLAVCSHTGVTSQSSVRVTLVTFSKRAFAWAMHQDESVKADKGHAQTCSRSEGLCSDLTHLGPWHGPRQYRTAQETIAGLPLPISYFLRSPVHE